MTNPQIPQNSNLMMFAGDSSMKINNVVNQPALVNIPGVQSVQAVQGVNPIPQPANIVTELKPANPIPGAIVNRPGLPVLPESQSLIKTAFPTAIPTVLPTSIPTPIPTPIPVPTTAGTIIKKTADTTSITHHLAVPPLQVGIAPAPGVPTPTAVPGAVATVPIDPNNHIFNMNVRYKGEINPMNPNINLNTPPLQEFQPNLSHIESKLENIDKISNEELTEGIYIGIFV